MKVFLADSRHTSLAFPESDFYDKFRSANRDGVSFVQFPEIADTVLIFEKWSYKTWDYIGELSGCDLVRRFSHKLLVINYDDAARGFLPGLYTSLPRPAFDADMHRACCYPETINEYCELADVAGLSAEPDIFCSFRGKVEHIRLRRDLTRRYARDARFVFTEVKGELHDHPRDECLLYAEEIRRSKFVLCPCGWAPVTYRLFETMAMGRCAVVISDDWVPIADIPWHDCILRVPERDVPKLTQILEEYAPRAKQMGQLARHIWEEKFSPTNRFREYMRVAVLLNKSRPKFSLQELKTRWSSHEFYRQHGWTLPQRFQSRLRREWSRLTNK